jgi:hypothetical protein
MKYLVYLLVFCFSPILGYSCGLDSIQVRIKIVPDDSYNETSWTLKDLDGFVYSSGRFSDIQPIQLDYCFPKTETFVFTLFDDYGDGICCDYGDGYFEVIVNNKLIYKGGSFNFNRSVYINDVDGSWCNKSINLNLGSRVDTIRYDKWFSFTPTESGFYQWSTCFPENTCDTKIWLYDYCLGLVWDETRAGSLSLADNECANGLAQMKVPLKKGKLYYIRLGDHFGSCKNKILKSTFDYLGPVPGCTNPNSCNFSPIAEIDDGSCLQPGDPRCPDAPDLKVDRDALLARIKLDSISNVDQCLVKENCLKGYGKRYVLKFDTKIDNVGEKDFYVGVPPEDTTVVNDTWKWDLCHKHWHYEGYAEYILVNSNNQKILAGNKTGFCLEDTECRLGGIAKYSCENQGISSKCSDVYTNDLPCQWIDLTELPAGNYTLVVRVNNLRKPDITGVYEKNYFNNWAQLCFKLNRWPSGKFRNYEIVSNCPIWTDCLGDAFGNAVPDCQGICGGNSLMGDINYDGFRRASDIAEYFNAALKKDTIPVRPCLDLNGDSKINVIDVALIYDCVLHFGNPTPGHPHTPCNFPYSIFQPKDSFQVYISGINTQEKYLEIGLINPNAKISGMQLKFSGIDITGGSHFITGYDGQVKGNKDNLIILTGSEKFIPKSTIPINKAFRVNYSNISGQVCLEAVEDGVNDLLERIPGKVNPSGKCLAVNSTEDISVGTLELYPNPVQEELQMLLSGIEGEEWIVKIRDLHGRIVMEKILNSGLQITSVKDLSTGFYSIEASSGGYKKIGKFIKQ